MKNFILLVLILVVVSCNTYKKAQRDIYSGNFDHALDNLIKKYRNDNIKSKDLTRWTEMFNTAYAKANAENVDQIYQAQYLPEGSDKHRSIYRHYQMLQLRYDKLKPVLPIVVDGNTIPIRHENFGLQLDNSRVKLANALVLEADVLISGLYKNDYRVAYDKYREVSTLIPNYIGIESKLSLAYEKGLTHVLVTINNDSRSLLPRNLHQDLTYFDSKRADLFWQKFHTDTRNQNYDFVLELNFRDINVSPELVDRTKNQFRKEWIDSSKFENDKQGNSKRIYENIKAQCEVVEVKQFKNARIQSEFILLDKFNHVVSRVSPVQSDFAFENISFIIKGDERAIDNKAFKKMKNNSACISFPSDEQMIYDCGMDLKNRFTGFVVDNIQDK